ncbi:MAG: BA14K family protein [Shinella zoogloeoides]|uniref:BA14K family protein n=1 Tax=Shinella zoogloeoides TaxID=352475 RepID=UPI003C709ACC
MRPTSKCLVVAISALFAATPVVPAGAMPLPVVKVQPADDGASVVQRVADRRYWRKWRNSGGQNWNRHDRSGYGPRHDRSGYGPRHNRYDRGRYYRHGPRYYRHGPRYGYYRHRHHSDAWVPFAMMGMGAMIGSAVANDRGYYRGGSSHVRWCANRYRSYRAYDNTFQPYHGPRRQCISPYR